MLRPILPLFDYVINQDYIAEFLCVNTDKPELDCNGKCYLVQELEQQNKDKKENLPKIAMEDYPIGFVHFISFASPKDTLYISISINYSNNYSFMYIANRFHPPNYFS